MKRKLLIPLLLFAVILMFAACDETSDANKQMGTDASAGDSTTAPDETDASSDSTGKQEAEGDTAEPSDSTASSETDAQAGETKAPDTGTVNDPSGETSNAPANGQITESEAKAIALKHAGVTAESITAYKAEYDRERGPDSYEIEFRVGSDKYEYDINAETGAIIEAEKNDRDILVTSDTTSPSLKTEAEAKTIVLAHAKVNSADVKRYVCELDKDDGISVYEIEFTVGAYEYEYEVNAETGDIIKAEKEFDD